MKHAMTGNEVYKEGECFGTEIVDTKVRREKVLSHLSCLKDGMEWRSGKIKHDWSIGMVYIEKDHPEPPRTAPHPAHAKDLPQLSTLPRSARAAETHLARVFAWGHAWVHSRPEVWQVWWAKLTLELPTGLAEVLVTLHQSLTSSSALCCCYLVSFHKYWCLFVNTVYAQLCLSVCPWKTQKERSMMSQQEPSHTSLVKDLSLYSKSHWKPSRVLSKQRLWFDSCMERTDFGCYMNVQLEEKWRVPGREGINDDFCTGQFAFEVPLCPPSRGLGWDLDLVWSLEKSRLEISKVTVLPKCLPANFN